MKYSRLYLTSIVIYLILLLTSCVQKEKNTTPKYYKGWNISLIRKVTDTTKVGSWLPNPEIHIQFSKVLDTTCLKPYADFYPIQYASYVGKKLRNYLMLHSNLFPPPPIQYENDEYIVFAWNFKSYGNEKCCDCEQLRNDLIQNYTLERNKLQLTLDALKK